MTGLFGHQGRGDRLHQVAGEGSRDGGHLRERGGAGGDPHQDPRPVDSGADRLHDQRIPMRRTGTPEEIAAVVHFLASPDCSFVTGQCYDASGGRATY